MRVFVSSTYADLAKHRRAINEVLMRMKLHLSAMEFFGSRTDEAVPACKREISECDILIGVYAWRYGWQPAKNESSITEQEFDYARELEKGCLCYVVDESFPWPPNMVDHGRPATRLKAFKKKVGTLVRSTFTSADDLAKQVAADLAREMLPRVPKASFGGLVRVNWEVFSPDLQAVLATAYAQAKVESKDGVVATRHVIAALSSIPNTGRPIVTAFAKVKLPTLKSNLRLPFLEEMFAYEKPISSCVLGSMERLLPLHSRVERLLAIEVAVDLLKHGTGTSVADFRRAGVDAKAVDTMVAHIRRIASKPEVIGKALSELNDAEIVHLAYVCEIIVPGHLDGSRLRVSLLQQAQDGGRIIYLVGEIVRRHPRLVGMA